MNLTITFIVLYCCVRFASDLFNNMKDVVFANVAATSEVAIASKVYNHVQGLSLAFHLSREVRDCVADLADRKNHSYCVQRFPILRPDSPIFTVQHFPHFVGDCVHPDRACVTLPMGVLPGCVYYRSALLHLHLRSHRMESQVLQGYEQQR